MASLHKFKLLATHCAVAGSPTRSPTTSPVIHLRRRKTLRMFLIRPDRRRFHHRDESDNITDDGRDPPKVDHKEARVRRKLKDLFVSSPPLEDNKAEKQEHEGLLPAVASSGRFRPGSALRRGGAAALRPVSSAFRYRFLRRAWRPVLVTIPE